MADNSGMDLSGESDGDDVTAHPSLYEDPTEDCTIIRVYSLIKKGFHQKYEETQGIELTLNEMDFENLFELSSSEGEIEEHLASETWNLRQDVSERSMDDGDVTAKVYQGSLSLGTSSHQEEDFSIPTLKKSTLTNETEMSSHNFQSQTELLPEPISATDTNAVFTSMLDLSAYTEDSIHMIVSEAMSKILDTLDSEVKFKSSVLNKSKRPHSGDMDNTEGSLRSENEQTPRRGGSISSKNSEDKDVGTILGFLVEEARKLPSQDFATCNVSWLSQQNAKRKLTFEENHEKKRETKDGHVHKHESMDLSTLFDSVIHKYKRLNEEGNLFDRKYKNVPREIVSNKKKRGRPRKDKGIDLIDKNGEISKQKPDNGNGRNFPETTMRKRGTSKKRRPITYAVVVPYSKGKKAIQPESPPKKKRKFTKNHENCHVKRKRKYTVIKKKNCPDIRNSSSSQSSGFCANIHEGLALRNVSVSVSIGPTNPFVSLCGRCHPQEVPRCEMNLKKITHEQDLDDQVPSHFSSGDQETYSGNERAHQVDHSYALTSSKQQETSPTQNLASVSEILQQFVNRRIPKDESDCDGKYKINLLPGDLYATPTIQHHEATPQLVPTPSPLTYPYIGSSVKPWIRYSGHGNEVIALMRPVLLDDPSCASEANILRFEPSAMDLSRQNNISSNFHQHSLDHNYALTSSNHQETFPKSSLSCFSPSFETFSEESSDVKSDNYFSDYEEESFSAQDFDQGPFALDLSTNRNAATNRESGGSLSDAHQENRQHIHPLQDASCDKDFQRKSFECLSTELPNINQGCANSSINSDTHAVNDFCEPKCFEDSARNLDNYGPTSNSNIQTTQIFCSNDQDKFSMNNTDLPEKQDNYTCPPDNLFTACLSQPVAPVNQFFQTTPHVYSSYQEVYEKQFLHAKNTCLTDVDQQSDLPKSTTDSLFDIQTNNGEEKRCTSDPSENCQDLKPLFDFESKPLNEQFSRYSMFHAYSSGSPQLSYLENFESTCDWTSEEIQSYADSASETDTCSYHDDYPQLQFGFDTLESPIDDKSELPDGKIGLSVQDLSTENGGFVQHEKEIDSSTMTVDHETSDGMGDADHSNVFNPTDINTSNFSFHDEQRADADGRSGAISVSQIPLSCPSIEEPCQYDSGFDSHNNEAYSQLGAKRQIPATHLQDGDYPFPKSYLNVSSIEEKNYHCQSLVTELNSSWQEQKVPTMSDASPTSLEDINQDEAALLLTQLCGDPTNYLDICSDISEESFNLSIFDLSTEMGSGSGIDSPGQSNIQELVCHGQPQQEELVCHGQPRQEELVCHGQPQQKGQSSGSQLDKDSILFVMADTVSSLFSEGLPKGLHMPPPSECDIVEIKAHQGSTSPGNERTFHSRVPDYHDLKSIENTFMAMSEDTMDWYGDEGLRYKDEKTCCSEDLNSEVVDVPELTRRFSSMVFCERCDFRCVVLENLFLHYWTCHRLEQMILCPGCRSVFVYLDVYKKHAVECQEKSCGLTVLR